MMAKEMLVYIGTYTEPILFGTGKVLQKIAVHGGRKGEAFLFLLKAGVNFDTAFLALPPTTV